MATADDPIKRAAGEAARHLDTIRGSRVSGASRPHDIERHLEAAYRFDRPGNVSAILDDLAGMLGRGIVHSTHPAYFGLFNPGVERSAVAASILVAAYNPQAAAYSHGGAAIAIEQHVLRFLASRIGYDPSSMAAHFTSGGQEANTESLIVALAGAFPTFRDRGVRSLAGDPVLYVSAEAHHSFEKAARIAGLGTESVVRIPVDATLRMDLGALAEAVERDRAASRLPFLVVGTAGATSSGVIDPLDRLAIFARRERLWFHVDAAWGGAACLSPKLSPLLVGIERADSITWDAHKWLQMPMGAGMFFTRHPGAPLAAFGTESPYMPRPRADSPDPYLVSHAWSRRAAGIPLFVALAELGEHAWAERIERMTALGEMLRGRLRDGGFVVRELSPLPVVCFTHPRIESGALTPGDVARTIHRRGRTWIAPTSLADGSRVLRASITNAWTEEHDLDLLVDELRLAV